MTGCEPTELERAVARAIAAPALEQFNICGRFDLMNLLLPLARAAIAEVFRHKHTDRSVPCPLCGSTVFKGDPQDLQRRLQGIAKELSKLSDDEVVERLKLAEWSSIEQSGLIYELRKRKYSLKAIQKAARATREFVDYALIWWAEYIGDEP